MRLSIQFFPRRITIGLAVWLMFAAVGSYGAPMEQRKFLDIDGIRTGYFEGGSGEAMLLVHGGHFGSTVSVYSWKPIFDYLAEHFHVYALDKLGQGYTDNPNRDQDYSMAAVVRHINGFMQTLDIREVHLVGHSRGALPVARLAADYPEMVRTLTIFDSNTLAPDDPSPASPAPTTQESLGQPAVPTTESVRRNLMLSPSTYLKKHVTDDYVEAELRVTLLPKLGEATERFQLLASRWADANPETNRNNPGLARRWWYEELKQETFGQIRSGQLKAPTLIIWGYNDPSARYPLAITLYNLLAATVERVELHLYNHCGHYPFQEYPEEITDLMVDFITHARD